MIYINGIRIKLDTINLAMSKIRAKLFTGPSVLMAVALVLIASSPIAGGIKKWVDKDGNVHFGDVPPPSVTNTETIKEIKGHTYNPKSSDQPRPIGAKSSGSDYDSPQNQPDRMKAGGQEEDLQSQQRRDAAEKSELLRQAREIQKMNAEKQRVINAENCERYQEYIEEYEHKLMKGYEAESDRHSDESHLAKLRSLKARNCNSH